MGKHLYCDLWEKEQADLVTRLKFVFGFYLKSIPWDELPEERGNEEDARPKQGDSGLSPGRPEQGVSSM